MRRESRRLSFGYGFLACLVAAIGILFLSVISKAYAAGPSDERLITIHDRGTERGLITKADTLRDVFKEAHIRLDTNDRVEPGLDEKLAGNNYQVNVYRARPVIIVDGHVQQLVMSAFQTPEQIAKQAGIRLHDEDTATLDLSTNLVRDGASLRVLIDRATPVRLTLYGETETVYTQATDVEGFLTEKTIELGPKDDMSAKPATAITAGMKLSIWRNGKQTVTRHESIPFDVEQIQDTDHEVGYKKVNTPGKKGKKLVTYQIEMRNGKEVSRKVIQTVVLKRASKQVEIIGAKPSFSGSFGAALAKLRSCEGGYGSWNPAGPYYGAYQFDRGTWSSVSNAPYGNATPAQQDAAAHALYLVRGWSPWPVCGADLPDIYR
jgi:uncharacterized protein YabE (DUF348 family)